MIAPAQYQNYRNSIYTRKHDSNTGVSNCKTVSHNLFHFPANPPSPMQSRLAATIAVAGAATGTLYSRRGIAYADAPSKDTVRLPQLSARGPNLTCYTQLPQRKPIYPSQLPVALAPSTPALETPTSTSTASTSRSPTSPTDPTDLSPTPTERLTTVISHLRKNLYHTSVSTENYVNSSLSSFFRAETNLANTVASLAPHPSTHEQVFPGVIYVS